MIYRKIAQFLGLVSPSDIPLRGYLSSAGDMTPGLEGEIMTLPTASKIAQSAPHTLSQINPETICTHLGLVHLEPVITRESKEIVGYELILNNSIKLVGSTPSPMLQKMHDELLLKSILALDIPHTLGNKDVFIRIDPSTLDHSLIPQLSGNNVVLAFHPDIKNADRQMMRCRELKSYGFRFSLDDFNYSPGLYPLLGLVDYLRFDVDVNNALNLKQQLESIPRLGEKTLIAKNVLASEVLAGVATLPFRLYQGSSHDYQGSSNSRNRAKIIVLMNMLKNRADTGDIEHAMKQDGAIVFRMLRYINSPANGLRQEAHSTGEVLAKYGHDTLYRWLSLLLFCDETTQSHHNRTLLENALLRGRLVELFGLCKLPAVERNDLFVTGMFSFLDHLFKLSLDKVLDYFTLSSSIKEALLNHNGPYAPFLKLALACENHDQAGIEYHSKTAGISIEQANMTYLKAVVWVHEIEN